MFCFSSENIEKRSKWQYWNIFQLALKLWEITASWLVIYLFIFHCCQYLELWTIVQPRFDWCSYFSLFQPWCQPKLIQQWRQRPNQRLPYKFVNRYLCILLNAVAGTELPPSKIQVQFRTKIRWTRCNFLLWVSVGRSRLWLAYVIQSFLTSYDNFVVHIYHIKSTSYWC